MRGLAEDLGVRIETRPDLSAPARWHRFREAPLRAPRLWGDDERPLRDVVFIQPDVQGAARRFALAHELGHAILDRELDGHSVELPVDEQERFASAFAAELLLPETSGAWARERFREAATARELLKLCQTLGAPTAVVMRRAARENWLAGLNVVWLDIRTLPNRVTRRDRRPRIYLHVRDSKRWFLPPNRSVRGALGDDAWLAGAGRQVSMFGTIDISRPRGDSGSLTHEDVPVAVTALRLRRAADGVGPELVARVELRVEEGV